MSMSPPGQPACVERLENYAWREDSEAPSTLKSHRGRSVQQNLRVVTKSDNVPIKIIDA